MGYAKIDPSIGELKAEVMGCRVLKPGTYQGRVVDVQDQFVTLTTGNGVHIEELHADLADKCLGFLRAGVAVQIKIEKVPGVSLVKHAGDKYAVQGPDRKLLTDYKELSDCVAWIEQSGMEPERIGVVEVEGVS